MKIVHHGAVDGVTGSCHELRIGNASLLIDCGMFQGAELSPNASVHSGDPLAIDFPIEHVRALVVTHVHIDHVGRLPHLIAAGFRGPIYCSRPSATLLPLVLEDALKVGVTRNRRLIEQFLARVESQLRPLPYGRWERVWAADEVTLDIKLKPAGHILGSAYVECQIGQARSLGIGGAPGRPRKVVFSGDLGAPYSPLLNAPRAPYGTDVLILESTYGDRCHEGRRERRRRLQSVLERAVSNRGTVLIPAFSIGRTQELLYELEDIIYRAGAKDPVWRDMDVVVDSPLASRFTEVYRALSGYWDQEARSRLQRGRHPLSFERLITIDSQDDHLKLVHYLRTSGRPAIVIAASGMCAGGRVVNYLKALLGDPRTDILFVGYQARGTPGRDILDYGPRGGWVSLDGERYPIAARVHRLSGYSAHADQADLIRFVMRMRRRPKEIRIVHGDEQAKRVLCDALQARLPESRVWIPGRE